MQEEGPLVSSEHGTGRAFLPRARRTDWEAVAGGRTPRGDPQRCIFLKVVTEDRLNLGLVDLALLGNLAGRTAAAFVSGNAVAV